MSASRLISMVSIFRNHAAFSSPFVHPIRLIRRPLSDPILSFRGYCSASSASTDTRDYAEEISSYSHPWPEWVAFVDRLKVKGYLSSTPNPVQEGIREVKAGGISNSDRNVYVNMHVLIHACMNFARDRFDIFNYLPREDIQTLVEVGCPNRLRIAIDSAKRLRAYVQLDEGDVCGACNVRGSCDRAYTVIDESEGSASTVDLVQILLFYALERYVIFNGEQQPPGRALVESSARNLLGNMITLSERPIDPTLTKPSLQAPLKKENFGNDKLSADVEMKRAPLKKENFGNDKLSADVEMKRGDWMCPNYMTSFMNRGSRLKRPLNPGVWECPSCKFLNYKRNTFCLKCNCLRPWDDPRL